MRTQQCSGFCYHIPQLSSVLKHVYLKRGLILIKICKAGEVLKLRLWLLGFYNIYFE